MAENQDSRSTTADILVVDDSVTSLRLLTEILSREGYQVRPANGPQVALESALAHPPSLILLDVRMPDMSGFEVCQRLKLDERTCDVPIIFVSALQDVQDRVRGFESGGVDFVSKPFQESEVLARVETHLRLRSMQLHLEELVAGRTAELMQANEALRAEIVERRRVEEKLEEGRDFLAGLTESMWEAVFSVRMPDRTIEWASDEFGLTGYDAQECIGRTTEFLYANRDEYLDFGEKLARTLDQGQSVLHAEQLLRRKNGQVFPAEISTTIFRRKDEVYRVTSVVSDITERKWMEEQYRTFFTENVSPVFWAEMKEPIPVDLPAEEQVDAIFREAYVKDVSDATAEMYGLTREELLGEMMAHLSAAESLDRNSALHRYYQRFVRSGYVAHSSEIQERTEDGRDVWLLMSIRGIVEDGHLMRIWGSQLDITKRRKAENALRESKAKYQAVVEGAVEGILVLQGGQREYYNLTWLEMTGYSAEEYESLPFLSLVHPVDLETVRGAYQNLVEEQVIDSLPSFRIITKSGDVKWVSVQGSIIDWDGEPAGMVFVEDVTEQKRAEEDLLKSNERLEEAQKTARIGDWEYDIQAGKTTWSAEMYRILGLDPGQYVPSARSDQELCFPEDIPALQHAFEQLFATGEEVDLDHRIVTPKGVVKFVRRRGRLILDEQGTPSLAIGTTEDITERKEAEQRVLEYQHRLQALASQLTLAEERERRRIARELHDEVGQRLTFARMGLASAREATSESQRDSTLDDVSQSLRLAIGDTRDLVFDLSSPLLDEVGLAAALDEWMEEQVGKKYSLQTEFVHDGQRLDLDDDMRAILFRSTRELLTNVVKHAQAKRVVVHLEGVETLVRIVVEDDGVGCDVDALPRAMEREGGFGLFSIQERMADLGGSLEITSEPGKGCKAVLTAPTAIQ